MQTAAKSVGEVLAWAGEHWLTLIIAGAAALALVKVYQLAATRFGPQDFTANGIVIGRAKAFDNRSLTLMLEQLDASLRAFNALSQNVAQNLGAIQEERSTELARRLKVAARAIAGKSPAKSDDANKKKTADSGNEVKATEKSETAAGTAGG